MPKENIFISCVCFARALQYVGNLQLHDLSGRMNAVVFSLRKQKEKCMDMCRIRMHLMCVCV